MAWLSGWSYRVPISVDMSALSESGTNDATVVLDATWDHFWATIDTDGDEIRVTAADGTTAATYQWQAGTFSKASKTGTIDIDNAPYSYAPSVTKLFLYYGNSGAASGAGSVQLSSAKTGYIDLLASANLVRVAGESPGALVPRITLPCTKTSVMPITLDLSGVLRRRCQSTGGRTLAEELLEAKATVNDTDDQPVASVVSAGGTRYLSCFRQIGQFVQFWIDGSAAGIADGSDYVLDATIYTTNSRTINVRVGLLCRDVRPRV